MELVYTSKDLENAIENGDEDLVFDIINQGDLTDEEIFYSLEKYKDDFVYYNNDDSYVAILKMENYGILLKTEDDNFKTVEIMDISEAIEEFENLSSPGYEEEE
ncbi:MAG: hypothetical protein NZZ41_00590 [Candidatus Dojkabacteria bacterium]|nr:hypothetical protein [Candidatus Dojkabacteria bacterium]